MSISRLSDKWLATSLHKERLSRLLSLTLLSCQAGNKNLHSYVLNSEEVENGAGEGFLGRLGVAVENIREKEI